MNTSSFINRITATIIPVLLLGVIFNSFVPPTSAAPAPTINYQGKLTDASGVAVANGTYNMWFFLYNATGGATTTNIWEEQLVGANQVQVTNGLFSVMLGSTTQDLASVNFNQPLYLGVEIGGSGSPSWDGEMSPRKPLGTVPAAFEAFKLGGVASSSFLRSDEADTMAANTASTLFTINQSGAGDILNLLDNGSEVFTVLDGGNVGIGTSSPYAKLSVNGDVVARNFIATSTTKYSHFGGESALVVSDTTDRLVAVKKHSVTSGPTRAITAVNEFVGGSASSGYNFGFNSFGYYSGAGDLTASDLSGGISGGRMGVRFVTDGTGEVSLATGLSVANQDIGSESPNVTELIGVQIEGSALSSLVMTDYSGIRVKSPSAVGSLTNSYGVRIDDVLVGTNRWGLYVDGTTQSYFGGNVGIGTSSPYAKLSVAGQVVGEYFTATSTTATSTFTNANFTGKVGIGTSSPLAKLTVEDGAVLFAGTTGSTPVSGAGTRMMWIPEKGAFRAGSVNGTQWDDANIGSNSAAFGSNNSATGSSAVVFGSANTAGGGSSAVFGNSNHANAQYSTVGGFLNYARETGATAFGAINNANGAYSAVFGTVNTTGGISSFASGGNNTASGDFSTALGSANIASGTASVAMGELTKAYFDNNIVFGSGINGSNRLTTTQANQFAVGFNTTVPQFVVNGDGNVGIGTSSPYAKLSVAGNIVATGTITTLEDATSTFAGNLAVNGTATSTFANGITLSAGCFKDASGNCIVSNVAETNSLATTITGIEDTEIFIGTGSNTGDFFAISGDATLANDGTLTLNATNANLTTLANLTTVGTIGTGVWQGTAIGTAYGGTGVTTLGGTNTILYTSALNTLASSSDFVFDGTSLGIGTSSPYAKLSVVGDTVITGTTTALSYVATADQAYFLNDTPVLTGSTTLNNFFLAGATPATTTVGSQYNYAIGDSALANLTTGDYNFAVGRNALKGAGAGMTGGQNNALGYSALFANTTGFNNNALGVTSLGLNTSGANNNALGFQSLRFNNTGSYNNAIGYKALDSNNGTGTIAIGYNAAENALTVDRGIFLGYDIDAFSTTEDDVLNIGNLLFGTGVDGTGTTYSSGNIGIGTSSPYAKLSVAGNIVATGTITTLEDATSTFAGNLAVNGTATSTFANGISLSAGCFQDASGNCIVSNVAETNSLATTITGIEDTEIFIGTGSNTGDFFAISGDATLANDGTLTLNATNANLTTLANLTTVGTIGTGVWQGTAIGAAYGGTGVTTLGGTNTILYTSALNTLASSSDFVFDGSYLGLGTSTPTALLTVGSSTPTQLATNELYNSAYVAGSLEVGGTNYASTFMTSGGVAMGAGRTKESIWNDSIGSLSGMYGLTTNQTNIKEVVAPTVFESATTNYTSATTLQNGNTLISYQDVGNSSYGTFVIYDPAGNQVVAPTVFASATTYDTSATTLQNGNIIIAYRDAGNSNYGTFVIYDPAGNQVVAPTVFESATTYYTSATTLQNGNLLIAYTDGGNSFYGTFVIYDPAGNQVVAPTVFEGASTYNISATTLQNGNVLIAYEDVDNSDYGTFVIYDPAGNQVVAPTVFESATTVLISATTLQNGNVLIAYQDVGNSSYGTFAIYDPAGNQVVAPTIFESAATTYISATTLQNGNTLIAYRDAGNSDYGTFVIYDPAGNQVVAPTVFASATTYYISATTLQNGNLIIAYRDDGNSGYGTFVIYGAAGTEFTSNLAVTTETEQSYNLFSIRGSSSVALASSTQLGTGDIFALNNSVGNVLTVANDGKVGIGTSSPYAKLSVAGEVVASHFTATNTAATSTFTGGFTFNGVGPGSNDIHISTKGKLSVGTYTDGPGVAVSGNFGGSYVGGFPAAMLLETDDAQAWNLVYGNKAAGTSSYMANYMTNDGDVLFGDDTQYGILQIRHSGGARGVGINMDDTLLAGADLDIRPDGLDSAPVLRLTSNRLTPVVDDLMGTLDFYSDRVGSVDNSIAQINAYHNGSAGGYLTFNVGEGAGTEAMRIASSSNVGIGTSSPYAKLSVAGNIVATGTITTLEDSANTFAGTLDVNGTATSTFANGITLEGGCLSVGGTCLQSAGDTNIVVAAADSDATLSAFADYVADGTHDEVQIQNAIDALPATGGTVHLLAGTFNVGTTTYTDRAIQLATSTRLIGEGKATVIKLQDNFNASINIIEAQNVQDVYVGHLAVDGNKVAQGAGAYDGIYFNSTGSSTIENTYVHDMKRHSIIMASGDNNVITANTINRSGSYGLYLSGSNNKNNFLTGNIVRHSGVHGISVAGNYNKVTGNTVEYSTQRGVEINGGWYNSVVGNITSNNTLSGIYLISGDHNSITGNISRDNHLNGINLVASVSNSIVGNTITSNDKVGINLSAGSARNSVTGNTVVNNGDTGSYASIYVGEVFFANDNLISSNNISATSSDALIEVANSSERTTIIGNFYTNPDTTTYISDAGTNTRYNEWDRTTITTDDERGYNLFSIRGSSSVALASSTQLGTGDIFALNNSVGNVLTVANDGNVGIGTSTPSTPLDIIGADATNGLYQLRLANSAGNGVQGIITDQGVAGEEDVALLLTQNDVGGNSLYFGGAGASNLNAANQILFYTGATYNTLNGTERLRIASNGRVSISDISADGLLEVSASGGSDDLLLLSSDDNNDGDLFIVKNSGNVGIGTTSPYAKLSVVGQVVGEYFTATSTTATSTFGGDLRVNGSYWLGSDRFVSGDGSNLSVGYTNVISGTNAFAYGGQNLASAATEVAVALGYLNSATGNLNSVAIGASNVASANNAFAIGNSNQATSTSAFAFGNVNRAGGANSIALGRSNKAYGVGSIAIGANITNTIAQSLMIGPSDTAKLTILDSGNVGIGTTTPTAKLTVIGDVLASQYTATNTLQLYSGETDGATSVGMYFDTAEKLDTSGAEVASFNTGGTNVLNIKYGTGIGPFSSDAAVIDSSEINATFGSLVLRTATLGSVLFKNNAGAGTLGVFPNANAFVTTQAGTAGTPASVLFGYNSGGSYFARFYTNGTYNSFEPTTPSSITLGSMGYGNSADGKWKGLYLNDSAPAYFGNGADAGIYFNGTNLIIDPNASTTGSHTVFNTGHVGIGTTTPTALLTIGSSTPTALGIPNLYNSAFISGLLEVGGIGDNYFAGNVGIGTTTPSSKLTVTGTTTIGNGNTTLQAGLHIGYGGLCVDDDGTCVASTTGRITGVEVQTGHSDLAETYFSSVALEAGELVTLTGGLSIDRAQKDTDTPVLGVVSTKPGFLLGFDDVSTTEGESSYPIALTGRVPVKLSTENGPIKQGDQLMLSSLPGIATKATGTGATIGIALEDFDDTRMYSDTYVNQFTDGIVNEVYGTTTKETVEAVVEDLEGTDSYTVSLDDDTKVKVGQVVMFVQMGYRWMDESQLATLSTLMGTTSLETEGVNEKETVLDRLVALANSFVDGVLSIFELRVDRVEVAKELCVDGVCVTADDLRALLDSVGDQPTPAPTPAPADNTTVPPEDNTSNDPSPTDNTNTNPSDTSTTTDTTVATGTAPTDTVVDETNASTSPDTVVDTGQATDVPPDPAEIVIDDTADTTVTATDTNLTEAGNEPVSPVVEPVLEVPVVADTAVEEMVAPAVEEESAPVAE